MDTTVRAWGIAALCGWACVCGYAAEPEAKSPIADFKSGPGTEPEGAKRMVKDADVWFDVKRKFVICDGQIALREGQLEMFACPKGTKEHESVVAVNAKAFQIHAGLLGVGAKPGKPVKFDPYTPATGQIIDVWVLWNDEKGQLKKARAQEWIKHARTEKQMPFDFVFAGSGFWKDDTTGKETYMAESGDLICVSNFATAMLDLPVPSSQVNDDLLFLAFTERIPPRGTKVRLVLHPREEKSEGKSEKKE
jgi:hypothetical protein